MEGEGNARCAIAASHERRTKKRHHRQTDGNALIYLVGAKGFEPSTSCSQKVNLIYNHYKYLDIIYTLLQFCVARTNLATYTLAFLAYSLVFLVNTLAYLAYTLVFLAFFSWNISCIIFGVKNCD